jgi:hypothetical protein
MLPSIRYYIILIFIILHSVVAGQELSTVSEVYDFEIGDIFHARYDEDAYYSDFYTRIDNIEILDKYYSIDNEKIFYVQSVNSKFISNYDPDWTYNNYIQTISFGDLDSAISHNYIEIDTAYSDPDYYNGRKINFGEYIDYSQWTSEEIKYVNGCGRAYYMWHYEDISWSISRKYQLKYFKKGEEEWGNPISALDKSTVEEIFNFNVGDKFHYRDSSYSSKNLGSGNCQYSNVEITGKYHSASGDTVFYIRKVKNTMGESFNDTVFYTDLDSFIRVDGTEIDSVFYSTGLFNERKTNQITIVAEEPPISSQEKFWYTDGCGLTYYILQILNNDSVFLRSLIYYEKGEEEWGEPFYVGIGEPYLYDMILYVYPNPANCLLFISPPPISSWIPSYQVFDMHGKVILSGAFHDFSYEINVSDLTGGVYILVLDDGQKIYSQKIVINR